MALTRDFVHPGRRGASGTGPTFSVELIAFVGLSFVIWNLTAHQ